MPRAAHPCPKCGEPVRGRCKACRQTGDQQRGTFRQRGYGTAHDSRFRRGVLTRHPTCVCPDTVHGHPSPCGTRSVHADHYPRDRRELVALGLDPDDPRYGRGLCHPCHSKHTALHQPGGWARRN